MGGFYSHSKSEVARDCKIMLILIYLSNREKSIGSHQAINDVKSDNDDSSRE